MNEKKVNKLTPKQELFCQEYVRIGNKTEAYKIAYSTKNMKSKTINERATRLSNEYKISTRIDELKKALEEKKLYTLEESVKRDLELIKKYESALEVLENINSSTKDVETAERLIRYIGVTGYNSAQDRLAKQHGFYEKDNEQKKDANVTVFELPSNGR